MPGGNIDTGADKKKGKEIEVQCELRCQSVLSVILYISQCTYFATLNITYYLGDTLNITYYLGEHRHHRGRHEAKATHDILHRLLLIANLPRLPAQLDGEQEAGGGNNRKDVEPRLVLQRQVVEKPVLRTPCGDVRVVPDIFQCENEK